MYYQLLFPDTEFFVVPVDADGDYKGKLEKNRGRDRGCYRRNKQNYETVFIDACIKRALANARA